MLKFLQIYVLFHNGFATESHMDINSEVVVYV